jgi:hypothetical protein
MKPIAAAAFGVEVDELRRLASIFAYPLQVIVIDERRNEAFFVLQLHRVEGAAVGIDADQKVASFGEGDHRGQFAGNSGEIGQGWCARLKELELQRAWRSA